MSRETIQDQAEHLKSLFNEIERGESDQLSVEEKLDTEHEHVRKIDVLNLPPRGEIHSVNKKWTRIKFGRPFLRLFFVVLILIAITLGAYYYWGDAFIEIINNL